MLILAFKQRSYYKKLLSGVNLPDQIVLPFIQMIKVVILRTCYSKP